jgi:methionine-rich copper-binding protein CopC
MACRRHHPHLLPGLRLAAAVAATTVLLWLTTGVAHAAPALVSADPLDGAALATAPTTVLLTFSAAPDPALSHVSARDTARREVSTGAPGRAGDTGLWLPVSITATGDYTVAYHVVFRGGGETAGVVVFSVGTGAAPARPTLGGPAAQAPATGHGHGIDGVSAVLLVADLLVAVAVPVLLLRRPRRRA